MKSLKHIFGLLMMTAMIIAAGCNKEENGGKKENLPHPNSTYKACPILAHFGNEKLGIKEIEFEYKYAYDTEQRWIGEKEGDVIYKYDVNGRLVEVKEYNHIWNIRYDAYGFVDSIYTNDNYWIFKYDKDKVYATHIMYYNNEKYTEIWKYSDDLHIIYAADESDIPFMKCRWENGNMVSQEFYHKREDGSRYSEKREYQYDNKPNIYISFNTWM